MSSKDIAGKTIQELASQKMYLAIREYKLRGSDLFGSCGVFTKLGLERKTLNSLIFLNLFNKGKSRVV